MSGPQRDDASKPTAWRNTDTGGLLLAVLVCFVLIDVGGWIGGQSGLIVFVLAVGQAASGSKLIQVSDNSFFTISLLISYKSGFQIGEIFGWKNSTEGISRRVIAVSIIIFVVLVIFVGGPVLNKTFGSFGYSRCAFEERVGFGKGRYEKLWFARDIVNCPKPPDPGVDVE